jgi:transcription termination factor Rho
MLSTTTHLAKHIRNFPPGTRLHLFSLFHHNKKNDDKNINEDSKAKARAREYIVAIANKNQQTYSHEKYIEENEFLRNKKTILLSPGGFKGVYMLGICSYIKEHYLLDDFLFSGASAGAWNALMLTCKKDFSSHINHIIYDSIREASSLLDIEKTIKKKILNIYSTEDFDLKRLFIGVTTIFERKPNTTIYTDFNNLEDAMDCCIASSHIPFITGGMVHKYKNIVSFDGGFSKYPYLNGPNNSIHIHPSMWKKNKLHNTNNNNLNNNNNNKEESKYYSFMTTFSIEEYTTLFSKHKYNFEKLFQNGYSDAKNNKEFLDKLFPSHPNE